MSPPAPELSEAIPVNRIGRDPITVRIEAAVAERAALARRLDLLALDRLTADLVVRRSGRAHLIVTGRFSAHVTQRCVVTTEPVASVVEDDIHAEFVQDGVEADWMEVDLDPLSEEPEPLSAPVLDVGEVVTQHLALALDPYPRAPGADAVVARYAPDEAEDSTKDTPNDKIEDGSDPDEDAADRQSPFAALEVLRRRH